MKLVRLLYYLFLWTWRCTTLSNVPIILILGSLSNDDGDAQQERQKSSWFRLAKQHLCTCITLFCTFPRRHCTTTMWKCLNFTFCREREHKTTTFFFFSWTSIQYFRIQLQKTANIWQIERDGISAIKFEVARLHFVSEVFVAVAVAVAVAVVAA